jgi:Na+/H+ antiporter NhaD/arsenite permease-like protein
MGFIGLPRHLAEFIGALHLSPFALMLLLIVFFIILGCFLDGISMVVLTIAVLLPTVQAAGFDLIWFGIFIVLVVEMAQITPPVGFNLFVLQGLTKREVTWIARTAMPLFFLMIAAVFATYFFPTWSVAATPDAGLSHSAPTGVHHEDALDRRAGSGALSHGPMLHAQTTWKLATGYRAESFHTQNIAQFA